MMIRPELENGKMFYELETGITYMNKGQEDIAKTLVLHEPVKDSAVECIKLSAMIQKSSGESMRAFFGDDVMNKKDKEEDIIGEEVVPFHKRKKDNPEKVAKEVMKEAQGISQIVLMSENIERILKAGKELLTRVRNSNETTCLLTIEDERGTRVTPELFKDMDISDQVFIICLYYCFFGLSSIGIRKTTSSVEQE